MHPIFLLLVGAIFIFFSSIIQLFTRRQKNRYLTILLSLSLFGIIWYVMIFLLTTSGDIHKYPFLYNKGLPIYYLIAPSFFLYVKGSIDVEHSCFKISHLFHMLLALPGLFSIIPYNLLDAERQRIVVERIVNDMNLLFNPNPYIVSNWHWIVLPSLAFVYCIVLFKIIYQTQRSRKFKKTSITWLYIYTTVLMLFFLCMLFATLKAKFDTQGALYIFREGKFVFFGCFCIFILSLLFSMNPEFIFGANDGSTNRFGLKRNLVNDRKQIELSPVKSDDNPQDELNSNHTTNIADQNEVTIKDLRTKKIDPELVNRVETFIIHKQIFRQPGLTLSELSSLCDLPNHKLSDLFNNYYRLSFNNYINNLRIEYIKKRLEQGDWKRFTLEAIASDAGFMTRNTFFVAFKKVTGVTPSNYVAGIKQVDPR